jgi:glycosyltransferase involved in cell wall biosynthesis
LLENHTIAVVIPSFKVSNQVLSVLKEIGPEVDKIYVVDDACPDGSGRLVQTKCLDSRVEVLFHETNLGVGGATKTGYSKALQLGFDIVVKLDGDGQMDPSLIKQIVSPIVRGQADYVKGNRFDKIEDLKQMPKVRIFGNAVLSLVSKVSTGYWNITDPTNGFTAIHKSVLRELQLPKISNDYFFESDMLFRLSIGGAVVKDLSIAATYGSEESNLRVWKTIRDFPMKYFRNFNKRIFYSYYLRELNIASLELPAGILLFVFGVYFGLTRWADAASNGIPATAGTVMLSAVPVILGFQLILAFVSYDINSVPKTPKQDN